MSRIPPSLLYLTIYNPTLKPALLDPDNEDAEEQAHILFYTAREHAVSRDRILRQVGLAKALVNFSEIFNAGVPCESVHSQARRMVMFSPEPNFWVHACYEVAKTPRPPPNTAKDKEGKGKNKGKQKDPPTRPAVLYDYHDGSVHDIALRSHFQRGYEDFKLVHGSFTSILDALGQNALELQLERFFTVWAWKWDVDDDDFGVHLGTPLHPSHTELTPVLDQFATTLSDKQTIFALIPPYVIPPQTPRYPSELVRYVLARIPPPATPVPPKKSSTPAQSQPKPPFSATSEQASDSTTKSSAPSSEAVFTMPLAMPTLPPMPSMNFSLDMKNVKWNWPNYLTFGKGGGIAKPTPSNPSSPPSVPASLAAVVDPKGSDGDAGLKPPARKDTLDVDTASLLEAISSESIGSYTRAASPAPSALSRSSQLGESSGAVTGGDASPVVSPDNTFLTASPSDAISSTLPLPSIDIPARPIRNFLSSTVHLMTSEGSLATQRRRVLHLTQDEITVVVVVDIDHNLDLSRLAEDALSLIQRMQTVLLENGRRGDSNIPTAAKILQPKDKYIVSTNGYTTGGAHGFTSRSEHLYHGQTLLRSGQDITEVFSRGQNPQHWHIGKRGLGTGTDGRQVEGEAFLEVARKETTLTDVDNELAGVVRRFLEQMPSPPAERTERDLS